MNRSNRDRVIPIAPFYKVVQAKEFLDFVRLSLITDAVSVVTIHGGDTVVQQAPLDWKIGTIIYDCIARVLAGHLLGYFMKFTESTGRSVSMIRHYVCWLTLLATTQVLATDYSPAIPLTSAKIQDHHTLTRIAFGSCFDQQEDDRIFNIISNQQPDLFLMIGDNVYPESEAHDHSLQSLRNAYGTLAKSGEFNLLRERTPIMVTWDDHDYGLNDAGGDWPLRSASEDLFEYVWVPEGDPRHTRDGIYFSRTIGPGDQRVQLIFLDTRSFRSPLRSPPNPLITKYQPDESPDKTMLGYRQWTWLEAMLTQTADLRIIVSSIQIIADGHAWEGWKMLPRERLKLYTLIKATGAKNVVLLSGDRHSAGLYQSNDVTSYPVWELTSSSLNKPMTAFVPKITSEPGPFRVGDNYHHVNFGMIDIYWEDRRVVLSIRDSTGKPVQDTAINLEEN